MEERVLGRREAGVCLLELFGFVCFVRLVSRSKALAWLEKCFVMQVRRPELFLESMKKYGYGGVCLTAGRQGQLAPWASLAGQLSLLGMFQARERACLKGNGT